MALATDGILGSLAISVHGAFDAVGAGLLELAAAAARFFAALQQTATGFSDVVLQHSAVMLTGMVAGAVVVLLVFNEIGVSFRRRCAIQKAAQTAVIRA
jgi:hypothetical protein